MGLLALCLGSGCTGLFGDLDDEEQGGSDEDSAAAALTEQDQIRRIPHAVYRNALIDVFGFAAEDVDGLALPVDKEVHGFTNAAELQTPYGLARAYFDHADMLAKAAVSDAAIATRIGAVCESTDAAQCLPAFVEGLGALLFGRPLTNDEVTRYVELALANAEHGDASSDPFLSAAQIAIQALLQAPAFTHALELGQEPGSGFGVYKRDPYEVARYLARTIWLSVPDDFLLDAAAGGQLADAESTAAVVSAMIDDPRARRMLHDYFDQMLRTYEFEELNRPAYPITDAVAAALIGEVHALVDDVAFEQNGTFSDLLLADYTFVNQHNAPLYGFDVEGEAMIRVDLDAQRYSGILTQAGYMASLATPDRPHLILRGARILERFLCIEMEPITITEDDLAAFVGDTLREEIEAGTGQPKCNACHQTINGVGFAFGAFDETGQVQLTDNGYPIDTNATIHFLDNGSLGVDAMSVDVSSPRDVAEIIATDPRGIHCFAERLATYARGAKPNLDDPLVERIADTELPIKELLTEVAIDALERKLAASRTAEEICQ